MGKETINLSDYDFIIKNKTRKNAIKKIFIEDKIFDFEFDFHFIGYKYHFKNCEFKKVKIFNYEDNYELIFQNCSFLNILDISDVKFKKNVKFWKSTFNKVNFHNATFNGLADFWSCSFNEDVIFYKTDFLGTTVFSAATFKKAVLFTYTSISKVIIFRGTKFENGLDLSQAIISGNLSLHDLKLNKFKAVDNTDDNKQYENYISETAQIPYSNKRETFRIIKQSYSKNGNEIDSLEFRKREHITFFNETWRNLLNGRKIGSSLQNSFILCLNLISNFFGVSWIISLVFISLIGGLFFLLSITEIPEFYFTYKPKEWEVEHLKYFLEFLNPTHKFDYIQKENLSTKFYFFDFFGRIFVGYGIYQFIQAFRKYK